MTDREFVEVIRGKINNELKEECTPFVRCYRGWEE
jgi:hypothetical protein